MRHLDLSFEGKHLAEKNQLDNGKLPHGGYRGSKKHPPSYLSYDKGREFQQRLEEELSKIMDVEDVAKHGGSPSWSILVHNSPSYTDESPLITNNLLAASKTAQISGISVYNRTSLLPKKVPRPQKMESSAYYRPNRMHQYLSATELKNSATEDPNIKYGRPTRTTLLRARQRSNSAHQLEKKRDFAQRLDEIKTAPAGTAAPTTEYLQLQSVRDGESLHSYLTGARYNRAHCLDSKSVEHTGVYMPRHNPALGMFFTGPKGQEYLQEFEESPRQDMPTPPSPPAAKRRPLTAPSYGRRPVFASPPTYKPEHSGSSKYKYLKLNIVGSRLPLVNTREAQQQLGLKLPKLAETATNMSDRRLEEALDQTYLVNQPMPSPLALAQGEPGLYSKLGRLEGELHAAGEVDSRVFRRMEEDATGVGAIRIEGKSTWKSKPAEPSSETEEEEDVSSVPVIVQGEIPTIEEEERNEEKEEAVETSREEEEEVVEKDEEKPQDVNDDTVIPQGGEEHQDEEERTNKEEEREQEEQIEEKLHEQEEEEPQEESPEYKEAEQDETQPGDLLDHTEETVVKKKEQEKDEDEDDNADGEERIQEVTEAVEDPQDQLDLQEEVQKEEKVELGEQEEEQSNQDGVMFFITQDVEGNAGFTQAQLESSFAQNETTGEKKNKEDSVLDELVDD